MGCGALSSSLSYTRPTISLSFPHGGPTPFWKAFFFVCEMGDQSESIRYRAIFESALNAYEKETGISLVEHPLSVQIRTCNTVESITARVRHQAIGLTGNEPQGTIRVMISIKIIVSISTKLYSTASLRYAISLVCQKSADGIFHIFDRFSQPLPPQKAIYAGIAILLAVCALL